MNDDFDCDGDDFMDDPDFMDDDSDCSFGMDDSLNDEMQEDSTDDANDIDWKDMATIGGLAEEFSEEEKLRRRIERKMKKDKDQNDI